MPAMLQYFTSLNNLLILGGSLTLAIIAFAPPKSYMVRGITMFAIAIVTAICSYIESTKADKERRQHEHTTDSIRVSTGTILNIDRKINSTQNKMDTTLARVDSVQTQVVKLQTEMDDFIHANVKSEGRYKKQRIEDAKSVCFAEIHIAMDRFFRLVNFYYYTKPEFRWKARDDLNGVYYLLVKMQTNLYLSTNPELKELMLKFKNMVDSRRVAINTYDQVCEELGQLKSKFQIFQEEAYPIIEKYEHPIRYRQEHTPR